MLYIKNINNSPKLYDENSQFILNNELLDFTIEYHFNNSLIVEEYSQKGIDKFLNKAISVPSNVELYVRPNGLSPDVNLRNKNKLIISNVFSSQRVKLPYIISYEVALYKEKEGFADTRYLNYYMPKWSTAYKFYASNHSKLIQPLYDSLRYSTQAFKQNLYSNLSTPNILGRFKIDNSSITNLINNAPSISKLIYKSINVFEPVYLDFGHDFNTIYIVDKNYTKDYELKIEGFINNQFITEKIIINTNAVKELFNSFNLITKVTVGTYNIENFNPLDFNIYIGNYILPDKLSYKERFNSSLELENNNILLKDSKENVLKVFYLNSNLYDTLYITSDDKVILRKDNIISTGKLDSKVNIDIPKNITYNNTKFIETEFMYRDSYNIRLYLKDYMSYSDQRVVSVSLLSSKGNKYYLNDKFELVQSNEIIYLTDYIAVKSDYVELEITLEDSEYIIINIEDYDKRYKVSNLILHPHIDIIQEYELEDNEELILIENYPLIKGKDYLKSILRETYINRNSEWSASLVDVNTADDFMLASITNTEYTEFDKYLSTNTVSVLSKTYRSNSSLICGEILWEVEGTFSDNTQYDYKINNNKLILGEDLSTVSSYKVLFNVEEEDVIKISFPEKFYNIKITSSSNNKLVANNTGDIFTHTVKESLDYSVMYLKKNTNSISILNSIGDEIKVINKGIFNTIQIDVSKKDLTNNYPVILNKEYCKIYPYKKGKDIICIGTSFTSKSLDTSLLVLNSETKYYAVVGKVFINGSYSYLYGLIPGGKNFNSSELVEYLFSQTYENSQDKDMLNWINKIMFLSNDKNDLIISPSEGLTTNVDATNIVWDPRWSTVYKNGYDVVDKEYNLIISKLPSKERQYIKDNLKQIMTNKYNSPVKNIKKYINLIDLINNGKEIKILGCQTSKLRINNV